ncbi:hypothetical protein IMY05_003G0064800 [Salix suchowensis]|nr:hypothetical protein IMY05_003G0064800 [Salix suchowensis]
MLNDRTSRVGRVAADNLISMCDYGLNEDKDDWASRCHQPMISLFFHGIGRAHGAEAEVEIAGRKAQYLLLHRFFSSSLILSLCFRLQRLTQVEYTTVDCGCLIISGFYSKSSSRLSPTICHSTLFSGFFVGSFVCCNLIGLLVDSSSVKLQFLNLDMSNF